MLRWQGGHGGYQKVEFQPAMIGTKASIIAIRRVGLNTTMVAALQGGFDARDAERACDPVVRWTVRCAQLRDRPCHPQKNLNL
jgi:hypothetical protein